MENTADKTIQTIDRIKNTIIDFLTVYGFQIIGALIILTIGLVIAWWLGRVLGQWLETKRVEPPIVMLAVRVIRLLVFLVALLQALDKLSVPIGPMLAGIGVAGVGIGLALQGVLGNLVAGLTIIFTKPFRVGEYIEVAGVSGQVKQIELFSTMLLHADMSLVMVPNRKLVGEILHNYGQIRQLDLGVGVGYGTDLDSAQKIVREILAANPRVLKDPAPFVGISALGDFSIQITIKPWTKVTDYNPAQVEIYEAIINQFRANKIEIPFPQREVRMIGSNQGA
ncbi:MAG TPA: mechanosensitive ion channel domain-containing protein [Candidatus Limnocylindrales bacterium]|nr:mechanosensitive ion channel domain-containing protein [Candidatus Limnocylindrales bacterium]